MKIHFGMHMDADVWPEFGEGQEALCGDVYLGPHGLVGLLETHFGLGGIPQPEALRIRRYMEALIDVSNSDAFYARSLKADVWATAREILAMRDELILHGWDGNADGAPARISDLAFCEAAMDIDSGLADRQRSVMRALSGQPKLPVRELILADSEDLLPLPWQALVRRLRECGVKVHSAKYEQSIPEKIVLLESEQPWLMAQSVACWLHGEAPESDTALLCSGDATLLDQALHHQAEPATGMTESSAHLGVFQLLPLVLENIWVPVRIARLMELLSVPCSPVPRFVARRLIRALSREPGLEGTEWREALEEIAEDKAAFLIKDGVDTSEAREQGRALAEDMDQWLRTSRVDDGRPAPVGLVSGHIERLMKHLGGLADMPEARVALGHCRDMVRILSTMREIDRALLENIVDDVIGPARSAMTRREAAPWGVVSHASLLTAPLDTLIWWNFCDDTASRRHVWSREEQEWLKGQGVILDTAERERGLERAQWLHALGCSRRLILCRPLQVDGEPVPVHPLWFEVEADDVLMNRVERVQPGDLFAADSSGLMGKPLGLKQVVPRRNPEPAVIKKVTPSDFRPEKLSPTALGDLFGCPFKWLVQTLGIAPSDGLSFSNDSTMIGTLAHQVLEDVFRTEPVPSEDEARKRAIESFDARLPEMAADLLTPERLADRNDIRARIIEAASDLSRIFKEAGFGRFECERRVETQLDGISVNGQADVIAYDGGGQGHIIDYKYSFSSYYRKKIEQGTDVQLITYARMLGKKQTPVAYYLVPKREMVTMFPDFGVPTVKTEVSVEEGWNRVRKTYGSALKSIREGDVLATGLLEKEACKKLESEKRKEGEIYLDPPCRFCDFGALCGLNVGGAENG